MGVPLRRQETHPSEAQDVDGAELGIVAVEGASYSLSSRRFFAY